MHDPQLVAERLLRASAASAGVDARIDWDASFEEGAWFMPPEWVSLYGTPLWQSMDHTSRVELSRQEMAALASGGIWTELCLMQMLGRYMAGRDLIDARTRYALTEVGEETRHSLMFARLISAMRCRAYTPPGYVNHLFSLTNVVYGRIGTFAVTLLSEEVNDLVQREAMKDERVQPLVRQVCRVHVTEEARHVSFARTELTHAMRTASAANVRVQRELVGVTAFVFMAHRMPATVYRAVGLDPAAARQQALANPHYREILRRSGHKAVTFLTEIGLISPRQRHWWRRAGLAP
ncbi:diiron oxygenase [Streptomyces flavidovirens]|uniref:AurF N-oxygenase family protein n=1 Tax=Streptomyces flavidovirens TaxID=67298 RepID=UPI00367DC612